MNNPPNLQPHSAPVNLRLEAIKVAVEWCKQLLTLAAATLVLSGTLYKNLQPADGGVAWPHALSVSWVAMGASVLSGLLFLGSLTNEFLVADQVADTQPNIEHPRLSRLANAQMFLFAAGLAIFIAFLVVNVAP